MFKGYLAVSQWSSYRAAGKGGQGVDGCATQRRVLQFSPAQVLVTSVTSWHIPVYIVSQFTFIPLVLFCTNVYSGCCSYFYYTWDGNFNKVGIRSCKTLDLALLRHTQWFDHVQYNHSLI